MPFSNWDAADGSAAGEACCADGAAGSAFATLGGADAAGFAAGAGAAAAFGAPSANSPTYSTFALSFSRFISLATAVLTRWLWRNWWMRGVACASLTGAGFDETIRNAATVSAVSLIWTSPSFVACTFASIVHRDLFRRDEAFVLCERHAAGTQPRGHALHRARLVRLLGHAGGEPILTAGSDLFDVEDPPLREKLRVLVVVLLDLFGRHLRLGGGKLLEIGAGEDVGFHRFDRLDHVRRAIELLLGRLLPRDLLVDQAIENLSFGLRNGLRRDIGAAGEHVVDLMDGDFVPIHPGSDLRGGLLLVLAAAADEARCEHGSQCENKHSCVHGTIYV